MVKIDSTNPTFGKYRYVISILSSLIFVSLTTISSNAQALACNDNVQVSLNINCEADITPAMILEGEDEDLLPNYSVAISGVSGTIVTAPGVYTVTVTDNTNDNSCWGNITVEDKMPPQIESCDCFAGDTNPDCQLLCTDLEALLAGTLNVPQPSVLENCGTLISEFSDEVSDGGCGEKIVTRSWLFTDDSGNQTTGCTQEFILSSINVGDVEAPVSPVIMTCAADASPEGILAYFTPTLGVDVATTYAYPTVGGVSVDGSICNLITTKTDLEIPVCNPVCSNSYKVIRDWLVLDWCNSQSTSFTQLIKAVDQDPPTVEANDITVSTDPWECVSNFLLPPPTILHDDCTNFVEYAVTGPPGVIISYNTNFNLYYAEGASKGNHTFTYVAYDCCENSASYDVTVTVVDNTPPVPVAKQNIVLSLTTNINGEGTAKLFAASVDNGSHDGCTNVKIEIRRDTDACNVTGNLTYNNDGHSDDNNNDLDAGQFVKFCCEDATNAIIDIDEDGENDLGYVKVWMRVWDDGDMNGQYGTAGDNYNETWAFVKVEDKLDPILVCPPDITIDCDQDEHDLTTVGSAEATTSCGDAGVEYNDIVTNLNGCDVGFIVRRWSVLGNPDVTCDQRITKTAGVPFNGNINFPSDYTTDCTNIGGDEEPTWNAPACAQIAYSVDSDTFQFEDGACFKILNEWTVIDWCQYELNDPNSGGIWTSIQIIRVLDDVAPVIDCEDVMYPVDDYTDADNDGNQCESKGLMLTNSASDNGDCASEWLKWEVKVDIYGDGTFDYEYSSLLSPFDGSFTNDSNGNGIPDVYLAPTSSGEDVKVTLPVDIQGSMNNHKVAWTVTDGCGNSTSCSNTFMVVDKKAPTPYCSDVSTALMESGMVEIWACDFDLGSYDNCTEEGDLRFTFSETPPQNDPDFDDELNCSSKAFTCDDLSDDPIMVRMYVWDEKGNSDFCEVELTLIDNQGGCDDNGMRISGNAENYSGESVEDVKIILQSAIVDLYKVDHTVNSGGYAFVNNPTGVSYSIEAEKEGDYLDGVSTLDLVVIQRHLLDLAPMNDAYKVIASDINGDEKISSADLLQLRKLILGVVTELSNQDSYAAIDANQEFYDVSDPWPIDYEIDIQSLDQHLTDQNFKILKIGDVTENADYGNIIAVKADTRSNEELNIEFENKLLERKNKSHIKMTAANSFILAGFQLAIDVYGLTDISVSSSNLTLNEHHYTMDGNTLKIVYAGIQDVEVSEGTELFTISGIPNREDKVENFIALNTKSSLISEAYTDQMSTADVTIKGREETAVTSLFEVEQNQPNPFRDLTVIKYQLATSSTVSITVQDVEGKTVFTSTKEGNKGHNQFILDGKDLAGPGVYFYTIVSNENKHNGKMVLVK